MKLISALLAIGLLVGCGFQLRSSDNWSANKTPVFVEINNLRSQLAQQIKRDLLARDVQTTNSLSSAKLIISVLEESDEQRSLTVGVDGRVKEYELIYRVRYAGHNQAGLLLAPESLTLRRIYAFDPKNILAKQREADELKEDLRRDMSQRLLQRFARLSIEPINKPTSNSNINVNVRKGG